MHEPALVSPVVQIDNRRLVSKHRTPYAAVTLVLQVGVGYTGRMLPNHTLSPSLRAGRRVARRGSRRRAGRGGRGPTAWPSLRELVVSSVSLDPFVAVHVVHRVLAGLPASQHPAAREDRQSAVKSGGKDENNPSPCPCLLRAWPHWYQFSGIFTTPSLALSIATTRGSTRIYFFCRFHGEIDR